MPVVPRRLDMDDVIEAFQKSSKYHLHAFVMYLCLTVLFLAAIESWFSASSEL